MITVRKHHVNVLLDRILPIWDAPAGTNRGTHVTTLPAMTTKAYKKMYEQVFVPEKYLPEDK
jgi:hypothetical protein